MLVFQDSFKPHFEKNKTLPSLTDSESGSDLYEELHRKDIRPLDQCQYDSEDEEEPPTLDWTPAPSLYYLRTTGNMSMVPRKKPGADVLSMLVGIYGSKDLFVDEYRIMLADKFLSRTDVNIDYEVQNLELLKIRFGETSMRNCEIMIKDMEDSKRINANIRSTLRNGPSSSNALTQDTDIDAVILSHIFWPTLQKETMKHHPRIKAQLDQFSFEYAKLKNPRRLIWFDQLGQMQLDLDVTLHDGTTITKDFTCTPLQATLITHFEDESSISATDLSNQTGIPVDVIKKKMAYWVLNDVIKAEPLSQNDTVYTLNPTINPDSTTSIGSSMQYDEDEIDGTSVVTGSREAEQIQIYESYIVGMLSNMGQLSLDRIHSMLKMYASTSSEVKYNHTPQQLRSFLQQLCTEEKLECSNGLYKILK
jgi:anaphase-promoting complex subunit 2